MQSINQTLGVRLMKIFNKPKSGQSKELYRWFCSEYRPSDCIYYRVIGKDDSLPKDKNIRPSSTGHDFIRFDKYKIYQTNHVNSMFAVLDATATVDSDYRESKGLKYIFKTTLEKIRKITDEDEEIGYYKIWSCGQIRWVYQKI